MALAPSRAVCANGVVVTAKQSRKTPAVTMNLAMRAGSVCDPPGAGGAMHLLARVIDRGTVSRTAEEIAEELDNRGISLTVTVNRHLLSLVCTCLAEDFRPILSLFGDVLKAPTIPDVEVAKRKAELVTAIRQDEDNPAVQAVELLMAALYGSDHPYGRRPKGSTESVEALSRDRLAALQQQRFAPSELSVVVVGDVEAALALDVAEEVFGGWTRPAPPPVALAPVPRGNGRRTLVHAMTNKAQADIAYGFTSIKRLDPAYCAFWLMNNALGQYALGGRLGDSIRERQGMAYYVSSVFDPNILEGPLMIRAGVSPSNVARTIASIDEELTRLRADGLSAKELNESRQYIIGSMPRALETNAGIAGFLQTAEFFGLGLDYDERLPSLLHAVTLDDVNEAARRLLDPARATVVVAGPREDP